MFLSSFNNKRANNMTDQALILTKDQEKALTKLKAAFRACERSGIEIHGEFTTLYIINGYGLGDRHIVVNQGDEVSTHADYINPRCFKGCAADDGLSFSA
jgi:hypothetical protein